ncbi:MAG: phosphopantetheine-binding protein [Gemmatimonadaceae bacterium]
MTRETFTTEMVRWLNARVAPVDVTINADTPLFVRGLMDSIRVLELIAYTEQAIGFTIPDSRMRMDNFHTVARIADVFLREAGDAAA